MFEGRRTLESNGRYWVSIVLFDKYSIAFHVCICINFPNKFSLKKDVNHQDENNNIKSKTIELGDPLIESKDKIIQLINDENRKTDELFIQTTQLIETSLELNRKRFERIEHLQEDITKMKIIINMKDKTINTKNETIKELKKKKIKKDFMIAKLEKNYG